PSATTPKLSAQATSEYVPSVVPAGTVRVTVPLELDPAFSAGIPRAPASWMVGPTRKNRVVEAPPLSVPMLAVVSVALKVPPGVMMAGGFVSALTTRSGVHCARVYWIELKCRISRAGHGGCPNVNQYAAPPPGKLFSLSAQTGGPMRGVPAPPRAPRPAGGAAC